MLLRASFKKKAKTKIGISAFQIINIPEQNG